MKILVKAIYWITKLLGITKLQATNTILEVIIQELELVTPLQDKYKAYSMPQELGDKLWLIKKEYFSENKNK